MRIAISALSADNLSGTGTYTIELVRHLVPLLKDNKLIVFYPEGFMGFNPIASSPSVELHPIEIKSTLHRIWWEQTKLPELLIKCNVDGFHSPAFIAPFTTPCKYVVTCHDWGWKNYPESFPSQRRWYYKMAIPWSIRNASAVITDSNAIATEALKHNKKFIPIHLGPSPYVKRGAFPEELTNVRRRYDLPFRFLLTLSTIEPRKNLKFLLKVFSELKMNGYPLDLVITGRFGWGELEVPTQPEVREHIHFLGYVPEKDIPALYEVSETFVYPSIYEGFGIPVLDAMTSGKPIVISDDPALVEVTGKDGAISKAPDDINGWMEALKILSKSEEIRNSLGEKARNKAKQFSWHETARKTLDIYEKYF